MGFKIVFVRLSKVKLVKSAKFIAFLCLKMCPKLKTLFWCAQRSKTPLQKRVFPHKILHSICVVSTKSAHAHEVVSPQKFRNKHFYQKLLKNDNLAIKLVQ